MTTLTLPCSYFICQPPGNPESLRAQDDTEPVISSSPCAAPAHTAAKPETTGAARRRPSRRNTRPAFFHFEIRVHKRHGDNKDNATWRVAHGRGRHDGTSTSTAAALGGSARRRTACARQATTPSVPPRACPSAADTTEERKEMQRWCAPFP